MIISEPPGLRQFLLTLVLAVKICYSGAQIVMTPSTGCATLAVNFSGPAGATNILWTIGSKTTNVVNPSDNFLAGTFAIKFQGIVNGNPVTYTASLVVKPRPTGAFSFTMPATHCAPATVTMSGSGGSPGSTYAWSFGDLTPLGSGSFQVHTYVGQGSYVPAMTIVDAVTGCTAVANNQTGTVNISSPPLLLIQSATPLIACSNTLTTLLSASASVSGAPGGGPLSSFSWTFNTGSPASASGMNVGPVTFGPGFHQIILRGTDNNLCSSTTTAYASVGAPYLNVPATATMCMGDSIKPVVSSSELTFVYTAPGKAPITVNSNTLMYHNDKDTLSNGGLYIFTVTINPPSPCAAVTKTFAIFSEYFTPAVSVSNPTSSCNGSLAISFTGQAVSNTSASISYSWEAGGTAGLNSATPVQQTGNPVTFTFSQATHPNPYYIYPPFKPEIKMHMFSSSPGQCKTFAGYKDLGMVQRPTAWFYTDKSDGCGPLAVGIRDSTHTGPSHPVTSYTFFTGEAPSVSVTATGSMSPFTHTYSSSGTYSPFLVVTTSVGCIDTSFMHVISVANPPTPTLSLSSSTLCAGQTLQLNVGTSPSSTSVPHYHVHSGFGTFSHCINDNAPAWPFTHTGVHGFTVSALDNGCEGSAVMAQSVTVSGPYGTVRARGNCVPGQRRTLEFYAYLQEVSTATLFFGDNSSATITANPAGAFSHSVAHTYTASGDYVATLVSDKQGSGCSAHTFNLKVQVRDIKAKITYQNKVLPPLNQALGCIGLNFSFRGDSSIDEHAGCERGYIWRLTRGPFEYKVVDYATPVFTSTVLTLDTIYSLILEVKDVNGCVDTTARQFRVSKAYAEFSFSKNPICLSTPTVQLLHISQSLQHPFDTIKKVVWNFGDNTTFTTSNGTLSPVHQYLSAFSPSQTYTVTLQTTNNVGCVASKTLSLQVNNPYPNLQADKLFPCIPKGGTEIVSIYGDTGYSTYSLNSGLPNASWQTSTSNNAFSVPVNTTGVFSPTLVIIDNAGCSSSQSRTITAIGQPTASFIFGDNANKFCLPGTPTLISTSKEFNTPITHTIWTIGSNSTPAPGTGTFNNHIFTTPGVHTISLTVSHNQFCPSYTHGIVIVADPKAELRLSKDKFCLGDTIRVSLRDTSAVEGWRWFYGDFTPQNDIYAGSIFASMNPTLSYPYTIYPSDTLGGTSVTLRYFGTAGSCVRTVSKPITVIQLKASMWQTAGIYSHCLGSQDQFSGFSPDYWQLALNYNWDFGDGNKKPGQTVEHLYIQPGTFPVVLTVSDAAYGCRDTARRVMTVLPLPTASLSSIGGVMCPGDSALLFGAAAPGVSGSVTGTLSPTFPFQFNSALQFTTPVTAQQTTTFGLLVTDENNCQSAPATVEVRVLDKPVSRQWDTVVVIGQTVQLNAYAGSNFTYTWSPIDSLSCDTCYNPVSTTTVDITHTVIITDHPLQCFNTPGIYKIIIKPVVSLDVPTAFTPNGDGINDIIYPDGWGLKNLLYFRVYNRWGQLLFESTDLKNGWDGRYNGVLQNIETYVYQVAAETLLNTTLTKSGSFKLLR